MTSDFVTQSTDGSHDKTARCLLWIETGDKPCEPLLLEEGTTIVGRSPSANLRLSDPYVSRRHLQFTRTGDNVRVENLSRFGSMIDGTALTVPTILKSGQKISLSPDTTLRFTVDLEDLEEEPKTRIARAKSTTFPSDEDCAKPNGAPSRALRKSAGKFSLRTQISRFQSQILALVGTVAILLSVHQFLSPADYMYQFLLKRSPCQWLSLYAFLLGFACLLYRWGHWNRERRAFALLRARPSEVLGDGMAWRRYHRIQYYTPRMSQSELLVLAKDMTERDEDELRSAYTPVQDVIQILPLIGFFGTVLGLSIGLYANFSTAETGAGNTSFTAAIGTAFDTTLLALACTLALIVLQRLIRRKEDTLLSELGGYVDDMVGERFPENVEREKMPDSPVVSMVQELQTALTGLCRQIGERISKEIVEQRRAAQQQLQDQMSGFECTMEKVQEKLLGAAEGFGERMKEESTRVAENIALTVQQSWLASISGLKIEFASAMEAHGRQTLEHEHRHTQAVSEAITEGIGKLQTSLVHAVETDVCARLDAINNIQHDIVELQKTFADLKQNDNSIYQNVFSPIEEHLRVIRGQMEALPPSALQDSSAIVTALRESVGNLCRHIETVLKQPRRISIVEVSEPDKAPNE